jgi:CheY-like chemotaxis protein
VVAYTAYATAEDAHHLVDQGFDAVLIKPLTSRKLLDILNEVNAS